MSSKATLREQARAARRALPPEAREAASERIAEHALALPELAKGPAVGCYASTGSEVATTLLLRGMLAKGLRVAVPVLVGDAMRFVRLQHPWALVPGARNIPEPRQPWDEFDDDTLGVVFVPGLQFGRDGSRLGQGGGFFDRFLAEHPGATRVGLAFDAQMVDRVEAVEPHDQGMDVVVTETGRIRIGRKAPPSG